MKETARIGKEEEEKKSETSDVLIVFLEQVSGFGQPKLDLTGENFNRKTKKR